MVDSIRQVSSLTQGAGGGLNRCPSPHGVFVSAGGVRYPFVHFMDGGGRRSKPPGFAHGGGFSGERETPPALTPSFTQCFDPSARRVSLNRRRILRSLFVSILIGSLAVTHVYVRFVISDMRMQHFGLQEQQRDLLRQVAQIEHENSALADLVKLKEYGYNELKMVDTQPTERADAVLPQSIRERSFGPGRGLTAMNVLKGMNDSLELDAGLFRRVLLTITDVNRAFAEAVGIENFAQKIPGLPHPNSQPKP